MYSRKCGAVGAHDSCFGDVRLRGVHGCEFYRCAGRRETFVGVEGSPFAQVLGVGDRQPNFFGRVTQFADDDELPVQGFALVNLHAGRRVLACIGLERSFLSGRSLS